MADRLEIPADAVLVGRVVGAWGVRGWVRVAPFNDARDSLLLALAEWWLRGKGDARVVRVEEARVHGRELVAKFDGIDDRTAAEAFDGFEVLLSRARFPAPAADEIYWADLIGCTVRNPSGEVLGVVTGIDDHVAHPVLRLSDVDEHGAPAPDRLIPLIPEVIVRVDLAERFVLADWRRDY